MDALQADYGKNIYTVRAELESPKTETMLPRVRKLAGVIGKTYVAMTSTGKGKCDNRQFEAPSTTVHCQQLTSGCAYDRRLVGACLAIPLAQNCAVIIRNETLSFSSWVYSCMFPLT